MTSSLEDLIPIEGEPYGVADGHVYLKRADTLDHYQWGGECMRITDGESDDGTPTITTKLNVRGGVKRDRVRDGVPGPTTVTLEMKRTRGLKVKTLLRECWWMIDQRMHCGGMDRDAWDKWEEITRYCMANSNGRTMTGINWESPEGEAMVGFPMTVLDMVDFYRVSGAGGLVDSLAASITDISACKAAQCPGKCDDERDCVLAAVTTLVAASSPRLLINVEGGALNAWTPTILTEWTTGGASRVLCMGDFIIIVSTAETAILRSDNRGANRVEIDETDVTDWGLNPPTCIDGISQGLIVMGGQNGYIYRSTDGGRTWATVSAGSATDQDLAQIRICRDDPMTMYAVGASNALVKSTNGGLVWFPLTGPSPADGLLDIMPLDRSRLLVINDDAEVHQSLDGGLSWAIQNYVHEDLPATLTAARFAYCGCDEVWLTATDGTNNLVLRNMEGGADSYWYNKIDAEWEGDGSGFLENDPAAMACCGPNHAVVVGGNGTDEAFVYLLTA